MWGTVSLWFWLAFPGVAKMLSVFFNVFIGHLYFFFGEIPVSIEYFKILLPHLRNVARRTKLEGVIFKTDLKLKTLFLQL